MKTSKLTPKQEIIATSSLGLTVLGIMLYLFLPFFNIHSLFPNL